MCNNRSYFGSGISRRFCSNIAGASALEFAIVAPVFLALVFAIFAVGRIYFDRQSFQFAVEQAGRQIAISQSVTEAELRAAIESQLDTIGSPEIAIAYSVLTINGNRVGHLAATMTRSYSVPLITTYDMNFTADTYMPVWQ